MADELTQLEKVMQLSDAVKKKDLKRVKEIYSNKEVPTYTGSALANACCYGGPRIARFLLENGATFSYRGMPANLNDLNAPYNYCWYQALAQPAKKACMSPLTSPLNDKERVEVVKLLNQYDFCYGFRVLLFVALQVCDRSVAETLLELGHRALPDWLPEILSGLYAQVKYLPGTETDYWDTIEQWIAYASNEDLAWMIRTFMKCDGMTHIAFRKSALYRNGLLISRFCSEEVFPVCLEYTNLAEKAVKKDLLEALVKEGNAGGLAQALELGWCRSIAGFDELQEYARAKEDVSPEVTAVLVEYAGKKRKPADRISVDQDPFAAGFVRRSWATSSIDGKLNLVSYKGKALDVVVPPRVGDREVKGVRPGAFDPCAPRVRPDMAEVRRNLHSVVFPGTIETIPPDLFHSLDEWAIVRTGSGRPSDYPEKLETIVLQDGVRKIEDAAFWALTGLSEAEIPDSVRHIGSEAFSFCSSLWRIHLPEELEYLGVGAFAYSGLTRIEVPFLKDGVPDSAFLCCTVLEECRLNDETQSIGRQAFSKCEKLRRADLPKSLKRIGAQAFSACTSLKTLELPEGLQAIGDAAFCESGLTKIVVPKSVTSIGMRAFCRCPDLEEVVILGEHTEIEPYAFADCARLRKISGSFEEIPMGAFMGCVALRTFSWGQKLHDIGSHAFSGSGLTSAMLPDSVKRIGECAFGACRQLAEVRVPSKAKVEPGAFSECTRLADDEQRIIVDKIMYAAQDDYTYRTPPASPKPNGRATFRVHKDRLSASEPPRITRIPPGIRLDSQFPEQDIYLTDGARPRVPVPAKSRLVSGEKVQFGVFPQTENREYMPIVWDVIRVEPDRALLLSQMELMFLDGFRFGADRDGKPVTAWKDARIRRILNQGFVPAAFTKEELECIASVKWKGSKAEDYAFLLAENQIRKYVDWPLCLSELTPCAKKQCPRTESTGANYWLTRTELGFGLAAINAKTGAPSRTGMTSGGIRPALWVKCSNLKPAGF